MPTWVCRGLWLILPVTLAEIFAVTLQNRSVMAGVIWQIFLWTGWAVVLGASFVQLPGTLTFIRVAIPLAPMLGLVFGLSGPWIDDVGILGLAGLVVAGACAVLVMSGDVGAEFINGTSYGDERRLGLRTPGFLLIGPLQVLWAVTTIPVLTFVALVATKFWIPGAVAGIIAGACAWYGFRLLNRLSLRCLVIVPAGLTLVDPLALAEPTLFRREDITRLGPALVDSKALDLTVGSSGLILSADFSRPLSVVPAAKRGHAAEATEVNGILLALSRPGQLLELAEDRRIKVERH